MKGGFTVRRPDTHIDGGTAIGCLIILFSGLAVIGGFLYFLKVVIALISGATII